MRQELRLGLCAIALTLASASNTMAATETASGKVCWTGKTNVIATTKADVAYTFYVDYVYTSDDEDPSKSLTGKCVGVEGIVGGKKESIPHFCTHHAQDGSTFMSRRLNDSANGTQTSVLFGGTGSRKGVTGSGKGGKTEKMKAPKGMFAGCRKVEAEYTLPD